MKRRKFIKLSASASALTLLPNEVFSMLQASGLNTCPNNSNKKIVLIQLNGGQSPHNFEQNGTNEFSFFNEGSKRHYPFDYYTGGGLWVKNTTRWSLWTVLKHHIMKGDLIMYDNVNPNDFGSLDGDLFKYPIYPAPGKNFDTDSLFKNEVLRLMATTTTKMNADGTPMMKTDPITGDVLRRTVNGIEEDIPEDPEVKWTCSNDIIEYRLKEDWFFDKERSQLDCRILGIAPVVYDGDRDKEGEFKLIKGKKILFWLYFPHCRFVLVNYNIYNPKNDAQWMSFDDLFNKRQFNSTIYKQSNTFDRTIDTYKSGVDALYESQRITEELRNFEHDLWQF